MEISLGSQELLCWWEVVQLAERYSVKVDVAGSSPALPAIFQDICKYHGLTDFRRTKAENHKRCIKCRTENVRKRRHKLKDMAIEYKGGKCENPLCGYDKCKRALSFHHKDPTQKDFGLSVRGLTRSWEKVKLELDKCIMLCANCHMEEHARLENEIY